MNHFVFKHENKSDVSNSDAYFGNGNKCDLELEFENDNCDNFCNVQLCPIPNLLVDEMICKILLKCILLMK